MQMLRDELTKIEEQIAALEARRKEIYRASVDAAPDQKVCEDFFAEMLGHPELSDGKVPEPRIVQAMTMTGDVVHSSRSSRRPNGAWVAVRPCDESLKNKTFLGVYLGDVALGISTRYHRESGVLELQHAFHNPAIWVPDIKRIVFGMGSWWGVIKGPDGLRQITDADINGTWYVQALKELSGAAERTAEYG